MKYFIVDTEDNEVVYLGNKKEMLDWLKDWNEQMQTDYKSKIEFNKKEEYYKIMKFAKQ